MAVALLVRLLLVALANVELIELLFVAECMSLAIQQPVEMVLMDKI